MSDIAPFDADFAYNIYDQRYKHPQDRNWSGTALRVATHPFDALAERSGRRVTEEQERIFNLIEDRRFMPGGRYLYATGRDLHQVNNCVLLRAEDSREGWAELSYRSEMALMTGAGIGVWYGDLREAGAPIRRTGGEASGPMGKMMMINDMGRYVMQGGARRSAIWAGLPWWHPDIFKFITCKDYSDAVKELKAADWTFPAPMDTTNISVTLDDEFFECFHSYESAEHIRTVWGDAPDGGDWHDWAQKVYWEALGHMLRHGEPGFTVDTGAHAGEVLRNACTEITSADDSDVCNLGSLVLPRFTSPEEFGEAVRDGVAFLTAGSVYSHIPYEKVGEVREKNRRLGLGLIGVHEFLIKRGVKYGSDDAFEVLDPYMREYARALEYAHEYQNHHGLTLSVGATAIAPNGTIGAVAESTPSADPMFSAAEQRAVKAANVHGADRYETHVVVDPVAKRLILEGADPSLIEDAATLSMFPERRLAQQAYLQDFTDHAISSTVNLPEVVTDQADLKHHGDTLMEYLPRLRGVTYYPDGARAGQPRQPVDLRWALANEGSRFESNVETCVGGACGV